MSGSSSADCTTDTDGYQRALEARVGEILDQHRAYDHYRGAGWINWAAIRNLYQFLHDDLLDWFNEAPPYTTGVAYDAIYFSPDDAVPPLPLPTFFNTIRRTTVQQEITRSIVRRHKAQDALMAQNCLVKFSVTDRSIHRILRKLLVPQDELVRVFDEEYERRVQAAERARDEPILRELHALPQTQSTRLAIMRTGARHQAYKWPTRVLVLRERAELEAWEELTSNVAYFGVLHVKPGGGHSLARATFQDITDVHGNPDVRVHLVFPQWNDALAREMEPFRQ